MDQSAIGLSGTTFNFGPEDDNLVGSAREYDDINERWIRFIDRNLFKYKVAEPAANRTCLEVTARSRSINGFTLARFRTTSGKYRLVRRAQEIGSDSRDRYVVYLPLSGDIEFAQFGRELTCGPSSSFAFLSAAEPLTHTKLGNNDTLCFLMPRVFVDQRLVNGQDKCARPSESAVGVGHLAGVSLATFARDAAKMSAQEFQSVCQMIGDIVLLALSCKADLMSGERTIRAANLARIKSIVRSRAADPDLSPGDIARQCRLSLSYIHNLFRDERRTLGEFVKSERLQRAHQLLKSPRTPRMTVTDVALECGFSSSSHFSRVFSQTFGLAPRDVLRGR
ncbi:MAG TPA: helix-turn-helix domain-containing protein [Steroidobacteraceae bacterium]|jgi:AraC-like DNA-binding protein|nr:helix-turn-helix domain-containing protein [Steroidobacteraceae bacterium]